MQNLRWMLGLGLALASCRSEGGNTPVDTDSGTVADIGTSAMDRPTGAPDGCVPSGAENTAASCMDNIDNDCNGFTDCRDFSCSRNNPAVTFCPDAGTSTRDGGTCVRMGNEDTAAACTDGIDNDCDGFRDCADFDCPRTTCPRDGGTATDRPACDSGGALENTAAACGDGIDNDCDGFVDCMDNNCSCQGSCPPGRFAPMGCTCRGSEDTTAACGDGVDNDCNSFVDCLDFSCSRSTTVSVCRDGSVTDTGSTSTDTGVSTDTGTSTDSGSTAVDVPAAD